MSVPIRIHPDNPKIFEFRGEPIALVTACEHYGGVMNRPFDGERYLVDTAERGINYTRLFTLFRELQSAANPYSTCKPESTDYIAPFERVGRERALDMQPKYDLDRWNPEFLERLHRFLSKASECGVIVELVLFSNTYGPDGWSLNPLHASNNLNGTESIPWYQYNTLRHPALRRYQEVYLRRMIEEVNRYDNLLIEICNEPGGGVGAADAPEPEEVNEWLDSMIRMVREIEATLPNQHLIVGQEAFAYKLREEAFNPIDVHQFCARSFGEMDYDAVNMHPLSNMKHAGNTYNLGRFMHAQMRLREYRDYCLDLYDEPKPLNLDEDNCATQYRSLLGWTIHRKRAWTALLSGAHYNLIDFSILPYIPTGTGDSQRYLRSCIGFLTRFVHTFDLVHSRPLRGVALSVPNAVCESVFGIMGEDFAVYLADAREVEDSNSGSLIRGTLELKAPTALYGVSCISPLTGAVSPEVPISSVEGILTVTLPEFQHDIVVRVRKLE
ncbi:MAG: cellulase family glycosylhydrolase [Armatimonadetes bacterium]|nr:cellulase family glycosylhydrolase [Armatimonadota bacterium]